jgi:4-hydroxy-tetrahydrodipicolinate synthase
MVAAGAVGVVSVASHLAGPQIKRMLELARSDDLGGATKLHHSLLPLFDSLFIEPNPMPLKAAMNELWGPVGEPRLPLVPALPETLEAVKAAMGKAQLP